jgi:hypothetical protein
MHISLNLGTPIPPDRQAELLGALEAERGRLLRVAARGDLASGSGRYWR